MTHFKIQTALSAIAIAIAGHSEAAFAQATSGAEPPAKEAESPGGPEEIVVTAQRRAQNLQDVPIAVSTLTATALNSAAVSTTEQLLTISPGFTLQRQLGGSTPFIRGVGTQTTAAGVESAVATYVDGVYYMSSYGNLFSFNNIEQVEVLRGPQGTLFGRNATGGLVSVTTRDPSAKPKFKASLSYGNYDTVEGSAYASAGTDRIAFDVAGQITRQAHGYGHNLLTGADVNFRREAGVRSKLVWKPEGDWKITLGGDYSKLESAMGFILQPVPGTLNVIGQPARGSRFDSTANFPQSNDTVSYGGSIKIEHDFGDVKLSSLSAIRRLTTKLNFDQDGSPARIVDIVLNQRDRTFQQEFLLQGNSGPLNYTAGLFYFNSDARFVPLVIRSVSPRNNFDLYSHISTKSYAAFAQVDYRLTHSTTVTAGVRYTSDSRDYASALVIPGGDPTNPANTLRGTAASKKFPKLTWRFAIMQKLNEDISVYASYSRGFKSGAFNTVTVSPAPIEPETIDAWEGGLRSEFLDRHLRFNVSGFHYDYSNIQLNRIQNGAALLLNAAKGRLYGGEVETSYVTAMGPGELSLNANLSLLHARYTSFPNGPVFTPTGVGGNSQSVGDLSGKHMVHSPESTFSLGASYVAPIGNDMKLEVSANYFHSAKFFWEADNGAVQPAYKLLSAQAAVSFDNGKYRVRAFGKNLTNSKYFSFVSSSVLGTLGSAAEPRTYGIGFDVNF